MKIAFLNYYSGLVSRGGETYVNELAKKLAVSNQVTVFQGGAAVVKTNYAVFQVAMSWDRPTPLPTTHILRRLFLDHDKLTELLFTLRSLPHLIRLKPDIVIALNSGWEVLISRIYASFSGARLIVAGQSGPGWDDRWNLLMKPACFVALTKAQLEWAKSATIWNQRFELIPNGVDLSKYTPIGKTENIKINKPIIIMVASPSPSKRVEQGIRAVARLKSASLLLLGTGPLDDIVNSIGYKLLGKDRFLHLSVSHPEMPAFYRSSDVFTLCSESSEAFGIVYLEAMASGLPCVATDDPSRREIVGTAGVFVQNPDDESEYANSLEFALKQKWGNKPRVQAENFSWDVIAEKYNRLFRSFSVSED